MALKLKANAFKLMPENIIIPELQNLQPGEAKEVNVALNNENGFAEIEGWPYSIDCALKVGEDVFLAKIPCCLSIGFRAGISMEVDQYKEIASNPEACKKQEVLPNQHSVEDFVKRLENNLLGLVFRRENGTNHLMSFSC